MNRRAQQVVVTLKLVASVAIITVALIPLFVLVNTISSAPRLPSDLPGPTRVFGDFRGIVGEVCGGVLPNGITLIPVADRIDLTSGLLTINLYMCLGPAAARGLRTSTIAAQGPQSSLSVPLAPFANSPGVGSPQRVGAVAVSIAGDPRRYPLDSYRAIVQLSLTSPSSTLRGFPLHVIPADDPGAGGYSWTGGGIYLLRTSEYFTPDKSTYIEVATFSVDAHRPAGTTRLFVLCLVMVPAILIVLLAVELSRSPPTSVEAIAGVAAIMLAIIPIRAVLVPTDIGSLTLVDYALAFEMAVLAAGTAFVYIWPNIPPAAWRWLHEKTARPTGRDANGANEDAVAAPGDTHPFAPAGKPGPGDDRGRVPHRPRGRKGSKAKPGRDTDLDRPGEATGGPGGSVPNPDSPS